MENINLLTSLTDDGAIAKSYAEFSYSKIRRSDEFLDALSDIGKPEGLSPDVIFGFQDYAIYLKNKVFKADDILTTTQNYVEGGENVNVQDLSDLSYISEDGTLEISYDDFSTQYISNTNEMKAQILAINSLSSNPTDGLKAEASYNSIMNATFDDGAVGLEKVVQYKNILMQDEIPLRKRIEYIMGSAGLTSASAELLANNGFNSLKIPVSIGQEDESAFELWASSIEVPDFNPTSVLSAIGAVATTSWNIISEVASSAYSYVRPHLRHLRVNYLQPILYSLNSDAENPYLSYGPTYMCGDEIGGTNSIHDFLDDTEGYTIVDSALCQSIYTVMDAGDIIKQDRMRLIHPSIASRIIGAIISYSDDTSLYYEDSETFGRSLVDCMKDNDYFSPSIQSFEAMRISYAISVKIHKILNAIMIYDFVKNQTDLNTSVDYLHDLYMFTSTISRDLIFDLHDLVDSDGHILFPVNNCERDTFPDGTYLWDQNKYTSVYYMNNLALDSRITATTTLYDLLRTPLASSVITDTAVYNKDEIPAEQYGEISMDFEFSSSTILDFNDIMDSYGNDHLLALIAYTKKLNPDQPKIGNAFIPYYHATTPTDYMYDILTKDEKISNFKSFGTKFLIGAGMTFVALKLLSARRRFRRGALNARIRQSEALYAHNYNISNGIINNTPTKLYIKYAKQTQLLESLGKMIGVGVVGAGVSKLASIANAKDVENRDIKQLISGE